MIYLKKLVKNPGLKSTTSISIVAIVIAGIGAGIVGGSLEPQNVEPTGKSVDTYVILAWNNLGMHCYNPDFSDLAVLPPYNTLWAQVIKVGDPPQIVTSGITVEYSFPKILTRQACVGVPIKQISGYMPRSSSISQRPCRRISDLRARAYQAAWTSQEIIL